MILLINTASDPARVALLFKEKRFCIEKVFPLNEKLSAVLIEYIDEMVRGIQEKEGKDFQMYQDIRGILCVRGPGHFTSIRIGVITANTLAFALDIPIIGVLIGKEDEGLRLLSEGKSDRAVVPEYDMAPDIGKSRK